MKILITGGAGYIGSILTETLLDASHEVMVLDNFWHGVQSLNHLCSNPQLEIICGDARELSDILPLIKEADIIVPLAARVGVDECNKDKSAAKSTNYDAIKMLVNFCPSDRRILYPMTNSGYGTSGESVCTEKSPLRPISLYGRTKCDAETEIVERGNYTVFRLATVFGMSPRMRWSLMVNDFVYRAVKDRCITLFEENFRRNFIHVRDVARAFMWAIENPVITNNQVFNLGNDDCNMTKMELAREIAEMTEFQISVAEHASDPDKRDYHVISSKIYRTGFKPVYSLDDGIKELIKGAKQYG